jgi:hypothetical protein
MNYSDKEKAALEYHERLHAVYAAMEEKKRSATLVYHPKLHANILSKRRKPMKKLNDIDKKQISDQTKMYASLGAAQVSDALRRLFTWTAERCDDANTYFIAISAKYRR